MFNNTVTDNSCSMRINAVNGTLVKNYKDSFFRRFHMKSKFAEQVLSENPTMSTQVTNGYGAKYSQNKPIVVLQVMLCGEGELIAEIMWKDDFDKMFKIIEEVQPESEDKE